MASKTNRTTTREAKARELIATGGVQLLPGTGTALVRGSGDNVYTVARVNGFPTCTCPDHTNRGARCKHLVAVELLSREYHAAREALANRQPGEKVKVSAALLRSMETYWQAKQNAAAVA